MSYIRYPYPKEVVEVAKKRIQGLLHWSCVSTVSFATLLESAYLQGVVDAVEAKEEEVNFIFKEKE